MQKRPKRCCPGVRAQLLVGELDLNGLIGAFELNSLAHRLVSRAFAHTWLVFLHKNNQPTNGGLNSTALLRLRRGQQFAHGRKQLSGHGALAGRWENVVKIA